MKTRSSLANDLRAIRNSRGLSQEHFGEVFNVAQQTYGIWERTGVVPETRWKQIKEVFGVDPADYQEENMLTLRDISGNKNITGNSVRVNKDRSGEQLSAEEQTLINLLREKDPTQVYLKRCIAELIMREMPERE